MRPRSTKPSAAQVRDEDRLLGIYLQDHLAVLRGAVELGNRVRAEHDAHWAQGAAQGFLTMVLDDRKELLRAARALSVEPSLVKEAGAWLGEKLGRLKLNGRISSRSPLSIVLELEAMCLLVAHGEALWRALEPIAAARPELELDPTRRVAAAREQRQDLLATLALASEQALSSSPRPGKEGVSQTAAPGANGHAASPS